LTLIPTIEYVLPQKGPLLDVPVPDPARAHPPFRRLECPQEIIEVLFGRTPIRWFLQPNFLALIQRYVGHLYVSVALNGDPLRRKPDFERLIGVDDVWIMGFRQPRMSQWRMMGRFVQQDHFVGLELYDRRFLDGQRKYHKVAEGFPDRWNMFTANKPIIVGSSVH